MTLAARLGNDAAEFIISAYRFQPDDGSEKHGKCQNSRRCTEFACLATENLDFAPTLGEYPCPMEILTYCRKLCNAVRQASNGVEKPAFQRACIALHRSIALAFGVFFVLAGLTGSVSVFRTELDQLVHREMYSVAANGETRSPNDWLASITAAHPRRFGSWTLFMPQDATDTVTAWFERPTETAGEAYSPLIVAVDPYTAQVVASRFWTDIVGSSLREWHESLFMGSFGRKIVGFVGIGLLVSLMSGLLLWWPGRRSRNRCSGSKTIPRADTVLFDLHRWLGVVSAAVLCVLALTGVHLAYPNLFGTVRASANAMDDIHASLNVLSTARPNGGRPVTLEESILLARGLYPRARVDRVQTPRDEAGSYQVWFRAATGDASDEPIAIVCVDQYSGHILHVEKLANQPLGARFLTWLHDLHTGRSIGLTGRIAWFLAGIAPMILFLTGIYRWRRARESARE